MSDNPNPNHEKLLKLIPGELHPVIIPVLKEWDQSVNNRFAEIRGEYDEYKPFKALIDNNIDPSFAQQAVNLAKALEQDPKGVLEQINTNWDLGYVDKDSAASVAPIDEGDEEFMNDDILKDPRVKAMADGLAAVQQQLKQQSEAEAEQQALEEFEAEMDALEAKAKEDKLPFDRTFVTALCANGYSGEDAVTQFHQILAAQGANTTQQQTTETPGDTPPVVLGGSPVGSGIADGTVKFGELSKNDLNGTIEQLLSSAQQSGQG